MAAASVPTDISRTLAQACKEQFAYGVVLYGNADLIPFGGKLAAAPLSSLSG
jgi:hypothetical protein